MTSKLSYLQFMKSASRSQSGTDLFDLLKSGGVLILGPAGSGRRLVVGDGDDVARRPGMAQVPLGGRRGGGGRHVRKERKTPRSTRGALRERELKYHICFKILCACACVCVLGVRACVRTCDF